MAVRPGMIRPIVLTTIYKDEDGNAPTLLVTTYKIDPKGEEFFASAEVLEKYDLKETFVNRIISLSGSGTHIPLINCRLMLEPTSVRTSLSSTINPYPRTDDYKNPFQRGKVSDKDKWTRISVGKSYRINFTPEFEATRGFSEKELFDMLGTENAEPLPRRARAPASSRTTDDKMIETKKSQISDKRKSSHVAAETVAKHNNDASSSILNNVRKVSTFTPIASWANSESDDANEELAMRKNIYLRKCLGLCTQHSLIYSPQKFEMTIKESDALDAFNDIFVSLESKHERIPDPRIEKLSGMKIVLISRGAKILGIAEKCDRVRGLEIEEDTVGMVVIDDKLT